MTSLACYGTHSDTSRPNHWAEWTFCDRTRHRRAHKDDGMFAGYRDDAANDGLYPLDFFGLDSPRQRRLRSPRIAILLRLHTLCRPDGRHLNVNDNTA